MKEKVVRLPDGVKFDALYLRMRVYVEIFFEHHNIPRGGTLNGRQPKDFVHDALMPLFDPYRNGYDYDPAKSSFATFMTSRVLKTLLRNALKREKWEREKHKEWAE